MSYFEGPVAANEIPRLKKQHERIRDFMLGREFLTLGEISEALAYPEASVSAQLRHLRKDRFGSFNVTKRRRTENGLWEYMVRSQDSERVA